MIRKLMASTAVLMLMSAGAFTASAEDAAQKPAVVDQTNAAAPTTNIADAGKVLAPDRPTLATVFIGRSVYAGEDANADNIGDVNDLIVSDNGTITDAVVGVGGFLGIGEKNVAVPFDKLKVVERDGDIRLIYSATRQELETAPALDRTAFDPVARYREEHAAADTSAAPGAPLTATAPGDLTAAPATTADTTKMAMPATDQQAAANQATSAPVMPADGMITAQPDQILATNLMGKDIYGPGDKSIGKVSDLVLEQGGDTRVALIDVGGFLGVGAKTVAIPFGELKIAKTDDGSAKVTVAMTADQLKDLPTYEAPKPAASADAPALAPAAGTAASGQMAADQPATTTTAPATDAQPADAMATGSIAGTAALASQDIPASQLVGASVYGANDTSIGTVSDVVFASDGKIAGLVIDVGGFLGIGAKPVAMGFDAVNIRKDENGTVSVTVTASKDQLNAAPTFDVTMR